MAAGVSLVIIIGFSSRSAFGHNALRAHWLGAALRAAPESTLHPCLWERVRSRDKVFRVATTLWPFAVLAICLATIVVLASFVRVHALFALIAAALLAGVLADKLPGAVLTSP
jgi:hypothetical protein